ncbi:hypothetical protein Ancab_015586 [Ancistrocladus abbreviatus]
MLQAQHDNFGVPASVKLITLDADMMEVEFAYPQQVDIAAEILKCSYEIFTKEFYTALQHGTKFQLAIFNNSNQETGVSDPYLPSLLVASYVSILASYLRTRRLYKELEMTSSYLILVKAKNDNALWDGLSTLMPDVPSMSSDVVEEGFMIDAAKYGNVGRFINNSCSLNLYAWNVLYDNDDKRIPHIMPFAAENIPP